MQLPEVNRTHDPACAVSVGNRGSIREQIRFTLSQSESHTIHGVLSEFEHPPHSLSLAQVADDALQELPAPLVLVKGQALRRRPVTWPTLSDLHLSMQHPLCQILAGIYRYIRLQRAT